MRPVLFRSTLLASAAAAFLLLAAWAAAPVAARAGDPKHDAAALTAETGVRGGLCLVVGARDTALAAALAARSALYVQTLQPDPPLAEKWGAIFASQECREREKLGVRNAGFDPQHYGSRLFNLIVVESPAAVGHAGLAEINRILVPRGVAAFRKLPAGFAAEANELGMEPVKIPGWEAAFRSPLRQVRWKLPLALKWHAGPRTQISNGYAGIATGDGKLFYMERMELDEGDLNKSAAVVFARDGYNGRTLWTWQAPGGWNRYNGLAATSDGRLFARTGNHKVFRLDGATGKTLAVLVPKVGRETRIRLLNDDLLLVGGDVYSTSSGKLLWKFPRYRYQPMRPTIIGQKVFFCDGKTLHAMRLADGHQLWKKPLPALPAPFARMTRADDRLLVRMKGSARDLCPIAVLNPADGTMLWSYTWKVRISKTERYFDARKVRPTTVDGKLLLYYRHNQEGSYADEVVVTRLDLATGSAEFEDRVLKNAGDFHGCFPELYLGDYIAYYDLWINKKTLATTLVRMPHPACFFGMTCGNGLVYNFPSRKSGPITAVGPADATLEEEPGGEMLKTYAAAPPAEEAAADDWPMFRGSPAGGNFATSKLGTRFAKAWEKPVGLGTESFGVMSSQRTGLTQAVSAYGMVVVSDIDGQRIVALDAADGSEKWVFHVGSRVDYPPTLYRGLCLFAARDGWVYCLDASSGRPLYKLLAAPGERYIGGREKLESKWPLTSDVLIVDGVAYVAYAGADLDFWKLGGGVAFRPETGQRVEADGPGEIALGLKPIPGGRELKTSYDLLIKGNSIPRTNEDNWHGFQRHKFRRRLDARVLAFDDTLTVAYTFKPKGEGWANRGTLHLRAIANDPAKPLWERAPIELVVDDILLTPQRVYCVGHYQRVRKAPELWVLSRQDGSVVNTMPVDGFPAFLGMSAAGGRLFISTREGRLLCYEAK